MAVVTAGGVLGYRKPAAGETVRLRIFLQDTTGAGVTGQTYNQAGMDVRVAKPGAAFVAWATIVGNAFATGNWSEVGLGAYDIILSGDVAGEANLLDTGGDVLVYCKTTAAAGGSGINLFRCVGSDVTRVAQWTDTKASYLDVAVSSRGTYSGTPPTADAIGTDAASKVLATPANKLATDSSGRVTAGSVTDKTGYSLSVTPPTAADNATAMLAATVDMPGATDKTVSQVLQAAWAQSAGKWVLSGTTLTLYAPDGTSAVATFTLDSATAPTTRTPA